LKTNSLSESENSAMKRDTMGPRPNMGIDRSQKAIEAHESRRLTKMGTNAIHSVSATMIEDCVGAQDLSTTLVEHGRNDLFSEFNSSLNYRRYKAPRGRYYVRRSKWSEVETNPESEEYYTSVVYRYDRTRIVSLMKSK